MMDSLIRKYLDGELTENESQRFLDALATDPDLNRQVAALEEVSDLGSRPEPMAVSPEFTAQVMEQVNALAGPVPVSSPRGFGRGLFNRPLPMAASWLLALGLGYVLAQGLTDGRDSAATVAGQAAPDNIARTVGSPAGNTPFPVKVVRLVYMSRENEVAQVAVAGSFNNWNPDSTPMSLENGYWVATLMLPPASYEYMFVVNGETWITDPLATTTRDDGFGSKNAILDLGV